jgi:cytochrome P450
VDVYYDPYDFEIDSDPYPVWKRLRDEQPLYFNEKHDFYALSRFADVEKGLLDVKTYSSAKGSLLELIKADIQMPPGTFIFEDPPTHDLHRGLLSRVFTPRKMAAIEPQVREFCALTLDPLVGSGGFDFIRDLGAQMPMRTIGLLLGIPEADQEAIRDSIDEGLRLADGEAPDPTGKVDDSGKVFAEYIDWRAEHPSDDLMTELLQAEFEDETGTVRRLRRDELLMYITVVSGAGNETTTRLIGWMGTTLADHPDQRRAVVEDRELVPNVVEEVLRFEPPAPHVGRYVAADAEFQGQTVPAGSAILLLVGAANRDEQRYENGEAFDIRRPPQAHLSFGYGSHFCLGASLARAEGRIALDELLKRFPEWEVDRASAHISPTSTVRGWETLPITVG